MFQFPIPRLMSIVSAFRASEGLSRAVQLQSRRGKFSSAAAFPTNDAQLPKIRASLRSDFRSCVSEKWRVGCFFCLFFFFVRDQSFSCGVRIAKQIVECWKIANFKLRYLYAVLLKIRSLALNRCSSLKKRHASDKQAIFSPRGACCQRCEVLRARRQAQFKVFCLVQQEKELRVKHRWKLLESANEALTLVAWR